jgi:hypothetical protein
MPLNGAIFITPTVFQQLVIPGDHIYYIYSRVLQLTDETATSAAAVYNYWSVLSLV